MSDIQYSMFVSTYFMKIAFYKIFLNRAKFLHIDQIGLYMRVLLIVEDKLILSTYCTFSRIVSLCFFQVDTV